MKERLLRYLESLCRDRTDLVRDNAAALPLFLRHRYAVYSARLFGGQFILALEGEDWETGTPAEYRRHWEALGTQLGGAVVLVLPRLPSYARNRMVQTNIPFIVPGSQTFIPNTLIDLRETFPRIQPKGRKKLSPAAQCIVLYHLLRGSLSGIPLKEVANRTRYSPMLMSMVKNELESLQICRAIRSGRTMMLDFMATSRPLWDQVTSQMTSPVKRMKWTCWEQPSPKGLLAGMSALSRHTMIADDRLPTYALPLSVFQGFLENGTLLECPDAEHAKMRIEIWSYPPDLLSDGPTVDPLSLYLSLRSSADERIQQQLGELITGVKW